MNRHDRIVAIFRLACITALTMVCSSCEPNSRNSQHDRGLSRAQARLDSANAHHFATMSKQSAQSLIQAQAALVFDLAKAGRPDEAISLLHKALAVEKEYSLSGAEESAASFMEQRLIDESIHVGDAFILSYLRNPAISQTSKRAALQYLQEVVDKEYSQPPTTDKKDSIEGKTEGGGKETEK